MLVKWCPFLIYFQFTCHSPQKKLYERQPDTMDISFRNGILLRLYCKNYRYLGMLRSTFRK